MFAHVSFGAGAKFEGAWFAGDAAFTRARFQSVAEFRRAHFGDNARFEAASINSWALFEYATFWGDTWFAGTIFESDARFGHAEFGRTTLFADAEFRGSAWLAEAEFEGHAWFERSKFSGDARFGHTKFGGDARFTQAEFDGYTAFDNAKFDRVANFSAVTGITIFDLANARFWFLPDFTQAHFTEAPRLDHIKIEKWSFKRLKWQGVKDYFQGHPNRPARWRALKRLAIQGHDHVSEQFFFKGELKSRRWREDKPWHDRFWFGWFYQWLSDFGRSMVRPLLWWALGIVVFAVAYLGHHPAFDELPPAVQGPPFHTSVAWARARALNFVAGTINDAPPPSIPCVAADDDPLLAAFGLSLRNGLLFFAFASTAKQNQIYRCLYGLEAPDRGATVPAERRLRFPPLVPNPITFLGLIQNLFSAALIFLFLLAVRNHFRIK